MAKLSLAAAGAATQATPAPQQQEYAITLPSVLDAPLVPMETNAPASPPYVQFMTKKAASWEETLRAVPSLQQGDAVLFQPGEPPVKMSPFRAHFVTGKQYWALTDDNYVLENVLFSDPGRAAGYTEFIDSVLIVYVGPLGQERLVPCTCRFRRATCPAGQKMHAALLSAASAEWGALSPEHKLSLQAPSPFMRFVATISTGAGTARGTGRVFVKADAVIVPTGPVQWQALGEFFRDADNKAAMDEIAETYKARLADVEDAAGPKARRAA